MTIKNKYPLPIIDNSYNQLQGDRYLSKVDLRSDNNITKIHFPNRYSHYKFLIMSLGLTNSLAAFM
uniref:Uncharacterized protein n=1 Tax=Solanum lycopersicum TaxID=4081 RepID=A0A3Q7I0A8_SOLLC